MQSALETHPRVFSLRAAAAAAIALVLTGCAPDPAKEQGDYLAQIQQFRVLKDQAMTSADSPIPPDRQPSLVPLAYFPASLEYRVPAVLRPSSERPTLEMPTSTGQLRTMMRVGRLEFTLRGQQLGLSAFIEAGTEDLTRLFVPFIDLTSGAETYPAGRYMDLDRTPTGLYVVDFNRAYHPYCYYNPAYDCPYPPRENRLQIPIRAGERIRE
jgi:uncharacterized protein (DUF1684 family)